MKAIVALSGGMDSATVLRRAMLENEDDVLAVSFYYGSKHARWELEAAQKVADRYAVAHKTIDIPHIFTDSPSHLMLHGGPIPEGHYQEESMKKTVVQGRNLIFASILASLAEAQGAKTIWMGMHSGDHAIYPDCRPEFTLALNMTIRHSTEGKVELKTPFLYQDKTGIINWGKRNHVPYELTRTCYKDQPVACGKCGSCQERLEAFENNGIKDPLPYETAVG